ncbi:MAG: hypothetical protein R2736_21555 [Solirubrobacterales bacterium]
MTIDAGRPDTTEAFVPEWRNAAYNCFPNWDTKRIAASRLDHLDWMHRHFARTVVSGEELLGG